MVRIEKWREKKWREGRGGEWRGGRKGKEGIGSKVEIMCEEKRGGER